MKHPIRWSLLIWILLAFFFLRGMFFYPRYKMDAANATISWDVFGYYLYLPATFIYHDLGNLGFVPGIMDQYHPAGDFHAATRADKGLYVMKYPVGMSVLYAPAFFTAHALAKPLGYPADGFSKPYQVILSVWMIVLAMFGFWVLRKFLLRYFSDGVTAAVLLTLGIGTNLFNYISFDGAMTHAPLFAAYACLLWLTDQWHDRPRTWVAVLIGVLLGWMTIIRPIEVLGALLPILWGITNWKTLVAKVQLLWKHRLQVIGMCVAGAAMLMLQLGYWKWSSGYWVYYSYGDEGFHFAHPKLWQGLISARKGWLAYTPVMFLTLLGLIPLFQKHRDRFWAVVAYFVLIFYVVFSWDNWWYGGGFGARALIGTYAALSLSLGALFTWAANTRFWRWPILAFWLFGVDVNLFMTWQAHSAGSGWHAEQMTPAYYRRIFLNAHPKIADKKFLDVRHDLGDLSNKKTSPLFALNFDADTLPPVSSEFSASAPKSYLLQPNQVFEAYRIKASDLPGGADTWVRFEAKFFFTQMVWGEYDHSRLVVLLQRNGENKKVYNVRVQWTGDAWQWHTLYMDCHLPKDLQPDDELIFRLENTPAGGPVWFDDVSGVWIETK